MPNNLERRLDQDQLKNQLGKSTKSWDMLKNKARRREEKSFDQSIKEYDKEMETTNKKPQESQKKLSKLIGQELKKGTNINEEDINIQAKDTRIESIKDAFQRQKKSFENLAKDLYDIQKNLIEVNNYELQLKDDLKFAHGPTEKQKLRAKQKNVEAWRTMYERMGKKIQKRIDLHDQEYSNQINNFKYQMGIKDQPVTANDGLKDYSRLPSNLSNVAQELVDKHGYTDHKAAMTALSDWHKDWWDKRAEERKAKLLCDKADEELAPLKHNLDKSADKLKKADEELNNAQVAFNQIDTHYNQLNADHETFQLRHQHANQLYQEAVQEFQNTQDDYNQALHGNNRDRIDELHEQIGNAQRPDGPLKTSKNELDEAQQKLDEAQKAREAAEKIRTKAQEKLDQVQQKRDTFQNIHDTNQDLYDDKDTELNRNDLYNTYNQAKQELRELQDHDIARAIKAAMGQDMRTLYKDHIPWPDQNELDAKIAAIGRETDMVEKMGRSEKQKLEIPKSSLRSWRGPKYAPLYPVKLVYGLGKDISNYSKLGFHRLARRYKRYQEQKELNNEIMKKLDGRRSFNINDATPDKMTIEELAKKSRILVEKDYDRREKNLDELMDRRDSVGKAMARIENKIQKARDKKDLINSRLIQGTSPINPSMYKGFSYWYSAKKMVLKGYQRTLNGKLSLMDSRIEKEQKKLDDKAKQLGYQPDRPPYGGPNDGYDYAPRGSFRKPLHVNKGYYDRSETNSKDFEQWRADMRRCSRAERKALLERGQVNRTILRLDRNLQELNNLIQQKENAEEGIDVTKGKILATQIEGQIKSHKDRIKEIDDYIKGEGNFKDKGIKDRYKHLTEDDQNAKLMRAILGKHLKRRSDAPLPSYTPPDASSNQKQDSKIWFPKHGKKDSSFATPPTSGGGTAFDDLLLSLLQAPEVIEYNNGSLI